MKTECSAIIEQQVKTIIAQSGCVVDFKAGGGTNKNDAVKNNTDIDDAMIMSSAGETVE